jgi:hypothetical protein
VRQVSQEMLVQRRYHQRLPDTSDDVEDHLMMWDNTWVPMLMKDSRTGELSFGINGSSLCSDS